MVIWIPGAIPQAFQMNAAPFALKAPSVETLAYYHGSSSSCFPAQTKAPSRMLPAGRFELN